MEYACKDKTIDVKYCDEQILVFYLRNLVKHLNL
jgi:membrane-bound inhibitor of C-type lysozyme